MDAIIQAARQHNLKVVDIPSDGNCRLQPIAHQLSLLETQITLRHEAVIFLRHHPQLLSLSEGVLFHHTGKNVQSANSYLNPISVVLLHVHLERSRDSTS